MILCPGSFERVFGLNGTSPRVAGEHEGVQTRWTCLEGKEGREGEKYCVVDGVEEEKVEVNLRGIVINPSGPSSPNPRSVQMAGAHPHPPTPATLARALSRVSSGRCSGVRLFPSARAFIHFLCQLFRSPRCV